MLRSLVGSEMCIRDRYCRSLTTIDFMPLTKVVTLGDHFLTGCVGLTTISLKGLECVKELSFGLLDGCTNLTVVDFTPLNNVVTVVPRPEGAFGSSNDNNIPPMFAGCTSLVVLNPPPTLPPPVGYVPSWVMKKQ
eukprot:TRINITY_DN16725_c0_g1_i2.p2 TRINITY_DN16725_c0_g1~~TRINITY_DN16725_c0_g1_i2.p2  ORF type:complete len:135 (+),score=19.49 TRINITY_DN16725_c0_g1_i2:119-523(+)